MSSTATDPTSTTRQRRRARPVVSSILGWLLSVAVVSFLVFMAVEALPGDAATQLLGPNASPERTERLREQLELDRPAVARYGSWLADLARGDLGRTASGGSTVAETMGRPLRNTLALAACAGLGAVVVAVGLGVAAGARAGRRSDRAVSTATLTAVATPDFVIAAVLIVVLGVSLGWLPAVSLVPAGGHPFDRPSILVAPAVAVAVSAGAFGARLVRAVVADAMTRPHVLAARSSGLAEHRIVARHVLGPAAGPIVRTLALMAPYLLAGTAAVERVVGYPGIGSLLVAALAARDVRVVEAVVVVLAALIVAVFVATDLIAARLDARLGGHIR